MPPVAFLLAAAVIVALVYQHLRKVQPAVGGREPPGAKADTAPTPSAQAPADVSSAAPLAVIVPKAGNAVTAQRIRTLAALIDKVWSDASGQSGPMPQAAKEIALAQAGAEHTGYGQGWDGDMKGSGNVAGRPWDEDLDALEGYQGTQETPWYRLVLHADSRPLPGGGQQPIKTTFRYYKDGGITPDGQSRSGPEAGAWDFIHAITQKPFPALAELLAGDILEYCRRQHAQHYFEGFNLSAEGMAAWADTIARLVKAGVTVRRQGETPEQVAGRIALYASSMARSLPEIAAALGLDRISAMVPAELMLFKPSFLASSKAGAA